MNPHRAIANIIQKLYQPIDGMKISLTERDRLQIVDSNYTYGEINPDTFIDMIELVSPKPGEVFYDLGSGTGKAVFCAALLNDWKKCGGVELLPALHEAAQNLAQVFENMPEVKKLYPSRSYLFSFLNQDFNQVDFSDADVVFLHATTFGQPNWDNLKAKLNKLKPGTRAIVNTKQLDNAYFEKIDEQVREMGWGESMVFTYRKHR